VTVYLEDPGGNSHCAAKGYQFVFDTQKARPKHLFWKKLVRTLKLKGFYWEWQKKVSDIEQFMCGTLKELRKPMEGETYRVRVLGKSDKHANRPGKGRMAQRKRKNFQGVWRPRPEHNTQVGTMTQDICQVERKQRIAQSAQWKRRDTRPKITIERRTKKGVEVETKDEEPETSPEEYPRPAEWMPLVLKSELIQLSEEGERKLSDSRMREWAQGQEEYEKGSRHWWIKRDGNQERRF
jgi:hypothetical protein